MNAHGGRILYTKPWLQPRVADAPHSAAEKPKSTHNAWADVPDHTSGPGANALALRIAAYWAERGKAVTTSVVSMGHTSVTDNTVVFGVRSDMVDGRPRT